MATAIVFYKVMPAWVSFSGVRDDDLLPCLPNTDIIQCFGVFTLCVCVCVCVCVRACVRACVVVCMSACAWYNKGGLYFGGVDAEADFFVLVRRKYISLDVDYL